jgi:hypothetical protein
VTKKTKNKKKNEWTTVEVPGNIITLMGRKKENNEQGEY